MQHEAVAAERDDHFGLVRIMISIEGRRSSAAFLRFLCRRCDEGEGVELAGHELSPSVIAGAGALPLVFASI